MTYADRTGRVFVICMAVLGALSLSSQELASQERVTLVLTIQGCEGDLGTFSRVTGLDVSFDLAEYRSGGTADVHRSFYPVDTPPEGVVTLSRAAEIDDDALTRCLSELDALGEPVAATIRMFDPAGEPIVEWEFTSGFPVKWSGHVEEGGNSVGMETLVLSHEGFVVRTCRRCVS